MANPNERSDAGAKVIVACKIPHGIALRGQVESNEREAIRGGSIDGRAYREFKTYRWDGKTEHQILGPSALEHAGLAERPLVVGGYVINKEVPKDLWDNWYSFNKDAPYCKNKMIFAWENLNRTQDEARGYSSVKTGFERIDPKEIAKSVRAAVTTAQRS